MLPPLFRKLVTYLLGQRFALLLLQVQGVSQFLRSLFSLRRHLKKGSVSGGLELLRRFQHFLHELRQALMLFHDLQLLPWNAWEIQLAYFTSDRSGRVNNRPDFGNIGEADQTRAWGNAD